MEKLKDFKFLLTETIETVLGDLLELEKIADEGNRDTTEPQTTRAPDSPYYTNHRENPKKFRCTVPIAMVCFSTIDMFGKWYNQCKNDDFVESASAFFKEIVDRDDLNNNNTTENFKDGFRHGITHSFYAKKEYSVSYPTYNTNSLFTNNGKTLDVKYLLSIVRKGFDKINREILLEKSDLIVTLYSGYQKDTHR